MIHGKHSITIVDHFFSILYCLLINGTLCFFKIAQGTDQSSFFAALLSLSLWTFGFTIAISAGDYESCLFWRRFSALGWGTFFAVLLHFTLLLTEKKELLKQWWIYLFIYFPAVVVVFAFSVSNDLAPILYNLVETEWGWINCCPSN